MAASTSSPKSIVGVRTNRNFQICCEDQKVQQRAFAPVEQRWMFTDSDFNCSSSLLEIGQSKETESLIQKSKSRKPEFALRERERERNHTSTKNSGKFSLLNPLLSLISVIQKAIIENSEERKD
ncbi:hypothetical protein L6452_19873 [Arctium lappa]|uniref:Uncharacterized protein n=1 Tax=Arctium lappa TaxID=4217 RepID=A0ACB9B915_ARCLA|nr:hypothetical protein L6452_19873 [Arctium lappa]